MINKIDNLVLLSDNYPLSHGEFFIDDEIRVINKSFEKIFVIIKNQDIMSSSRFIPENIEILKFDDTIKTKDKLFFLMVVFFKPIFYQELYFAFFKQKLNLSWALLKLIFMYLLRSVKLKRVIINFIEDYKIEISRTVFYSYWHDHKALALSLLKKQIKTAKCISRAHRWDIYYYAHKLPYLPFKKTIISTLDRTVSISNDGKRYFDALFPDYGLKVIVSRLGKNNLRQLNLNKDKNNSIKICSCSTLSSVKRVNSIIEVLALLKFENISWTHFGDGILRDEIESYAKRHLLNIEFEFKGLVSNNKILDFYEKHYIDLFINLSESEGIPVSIMEALSAGIPVLATNVGGTSEIVNFENGFLIEKDFQIGDVSNLIENYLKSSFETQIKYRQNAYMFWKKNYNADNNYNNFVNTLRGL